MTPSAFWSYSSPLRVSICFFEGLLKNTCCAPARLSSLEARSSRLGARLSSLETRSSRLGARSSRLGARLSSLETRSSRLGARSSRVEAAPQSNHTNPQKQSRQSRIRARLYTLPDRKIHAPRMPLRADNWVETRSGVLLKVYLCFGRRRVHSRGLEKTNTDGSRTPAVTSANLTIDR
jgi:hypothetical protein